MVQSISGSWAKERQHVWQFCHEWASGEIIAHTSGSTGTPKPIRLSRESIDASVRRTVDVFNLTSGSHLHSCVSARYIGGKMMVARALALSCLFTFETPSNRPSFPADQAIDLLAIVPSMVDHILLRHSLGTLPRIGAIIIGGAPLPQKIRNQLTYSGINAYETYGMTETASHIALRHVSTDPEEPFTVLPGIDIDIDSRGCLILKVDGIHGKIITNDIVHIVSPGKFRVLGRADNIIVTGGMKTVPEDVERKIAHLINEKFIVSSIPSDKWGEEVVIVIDDTGGSGIPEDIPPELAHALSELLPPHERPRAIIRRPIGRTDNGKLIRKS